MPYGKTRRHVFVREQKAISQSENPITNDQLAVVKRVENESTRWRDDANGINAKSDQPGDQRVKRATRNVRRNASANIKGLFPEERTRRRQYRYIFNGD